MDLAAVVASINTNLALVFGDNVGGIIDAFYVLFLPITAAIFSLAALVVVLRWAKASFFGPR